MDIIKLLECKAGHAAKQSVAPKLLCSLPKNLLSEAVAHAVSIPQAKISHVAGLFLASLTGFFPQANAGPFPAEFALASLLEENGGDGRDGFVLHGVSPSERMGGYLAGDADVNGDGLDDLVTASQFATYNYPFSYGYGRGYVLFGKDTLHTGDFPPELDLLSLVEGDGTRGFVMDGTEDQYSSRARVSMAGDVNGDGIGDVIFGEPGPENTPLQSQQGKSFVVFGRDSEQGSYFPSRLRLENLAAGDGSDGLVLNNGIYFYYEYAGYSVDGVADINGDGIDDIAIGAHKGYSDSSTPGKTYVVFGMDTAATGNFPPLTQLPTLAQGDGSLGFVIYGIDSGDQSGFSLSNAGDVNGDGVADLIIGAPRADPGGRADAGETYVIFGRLVSEGESFPAEIELAGLASGDGSTGFVLNGVDPGETSGRSVSGGQDVNGDGLDDLIIGSPYADPDNLFDAGRSFVVFGRAAADGDSFPAEIELSSIATGDGSSGFVINGTTPGDSWGWSVALIPDINDDGIGDVIIGAPFSRPDGGFSTGQAAVVFGQAGGFSADFDLAMLQEQNGGDGNAGFLLNGIKSSDLAGAAVSSAGDINNDGIHDIILGATGADPGGMESAGAAYIVFGRADADSDGISDARDNCLLSANQNQRDSDGDGIGNFCDADFNNDCAVNSADLVILKSVFFSGAPDADMNGDGSVNFIDLAILKASFFAPPGPAAPPNLCESLGEAGEG